MEAPGHEAIQKELADFWQRISEQFGNADTEPYLTGKCMYMGNWLTDISQLFAPEFYFDIQHSLPDKLNGLVDVIKSMQKSKRLSLIQKQFLTF
jgi:hypothetical protein